METGGGGLDAGNDVIVDEMIGRGDRERPKTSPSIDFFIVGCVVVGIDVVVIAKKGKSENGLKAEGWTLITTSSSTR